LDNNSFELSQPFLIDGILSFLGLCHNQFETDANSSLTPIAKGLLHQDLAGKLHKYDWKYRTAVGIPFLPPEHNLPGDIYVSTSSGLFLQSTYAFP
jgi:hypothetical protein